MGKRHNWAGVIFLFVVAEAITMQMRGPLLVSFQASFSLSEGQLGLIGPAGTIGFLLAILAVGFRTGALNLKRLLLVGAIGTAMSTFLVSQAPTFAFLLGLLVLQGITAGTFRAIDRPVLSHLFPVNRGRVFNIYTAVWAIGAASAPILVNILLSVGDWRTVYLTLGVVFVVPFLFLLTMERPAQLNNEESLSLAALRDVVKHPPVSGMAVGLILSGAVEGAIFTWLPYYAGQHFPSSTANLLLSVYLASYIPGRIMSGYLAGKVRYLTLLFFLIGGAIPAYAAVLVTTGVAMAASVAVAGFIIAGIFPTLFTFGIESAPEYSGPVNALATSANFFGISVSPVIVGLLAGGFGIGVAMSVPLVCLAILLIEISAIRWFGVESYLS